MHQFQTNKKLGIAMASLAGAMWAILAIIMKIALKFVDGYAISWFRFAFSLLILSIFLLIKNPQELKILKRPPLLGVLASFFLFLNYILYINGVKLTNPSLAQMFIQFAPLILVLIGSWIFKDKVSLKQWLGFTIALSGFVIYFYDQLTFSSDESFKQGTFLVVLAAFAWAFYGTCSKLLVKKYSTNQINLVLYAVPSVLMLPLLKADTFISFGLFEWFMMILLGLNTIIAYGAVAIAFKHLETPLVSMIITLNPLLTIAIMSLLAVMEVSWIEAKVIGIEGVIGASVVMIGAFLVLFKKAPHKVN